MDGVVTQTDVLIIGGGLVGLSTAMHLKQLRPRNSVVLIEKGDDIVGQQSGHNSGVLHAGIYYEPGSMKATFCVEGNRALGAFCEAHEIPLVRCGKVIVAGNDAEESRLEILHQRGTENGVPNLRLISGDELREIEPHVTGLAALHAPNSAIVDFRLVGRKYAEIFKGAGGKIVLGQRFLNGKREGGNYRIITDESEYEARLVINCAGLHSDVVARKLGIAPNIRIIPFRGEYYLLTPEARNLVKGLVYPVPNPALPFLDVHFTPKVNGEVEAGPNAVLATHREGYRRSDFSLHDFAGTLSFPGFWRLAARNLGPGLSEINRSLRKSVFVRSLQRLVPEIEPVHLAPGGSGVRAQAVDRRGALVDDFRIEEGPGAIHVLNAPSPAATSSLVIGRYVANKADLRINAG
jgi:L-2-hydroxyglutarate oxidase